MANRKRAKLVKRVRKVKLEQITYSHVALLLQVIREYYTGDPTSPGLVLSQLSDGQYYTSIVRYDGQYGTGKRIIYSCKAHTLHESIRGAIEYMVAQTSKATKLGQALKRGG